MTSLSAKLLVTVVGLVVVLPTLAEAAKARKHKKPVAVQASLAVQDGRLAYPHHVRHRGQNVFMAGPIFWGNDYLGDDPDPFIRSQIIRDGARYGGPD